MHESICSWPSLEFYAEKLVSHSSVGVRDPVEGFPWPPGSALAFVHIKGEEAKDPETRSVSNHAEARLATVVVKRLVNARSVGKAKAAVALAPHPQAAGPVQAQVLGQVVAVNNN